MSGPAEAAPQAAVLGLGLDISRRWNQKDTKQSRALVQTYLLPSFVHPPPTAGGGWGARTPLRLPSLTAQGPRRPSIARFSLSEPSLLTPHENALLEGFSNNRRPSVLKKGSAPPTPFSKSSVLLPCKTCLTSGTSKQQNYRQVQNCSRPAYFHFSQAIQPGSKPRPVRRHSHNPTLRAEMEQQGDLRPLVMQYRNSSPQGEPLYVVGKPCLPSSSERPAPSAAAGPARTQLHVFLPTEAEGEEVDSESVDEGFMDELDSKITSLKLQQGAAKTLTKGSSNIIGLYSI
ncbi:hypothetical protein CesoFtcFv8_019598 [Champsocephalus esox]|uniref:Uncharacterized protein n=1 Tax=Champsocephalus esox TaxID=159716 RepID=A0AAN8BE82_9TELE|nr:hypothetical protein CesoFtcFv8_019598 [Champsocephalus esox]